MKSLSVVRFLIIGFAFTVLAVGCAKQPVVEETPVPAQPTEVVVEQPVRSVVQEAPITECSMAMSAEEHAAEARSLGGTGW